MKCFEFGVLVLVAVSLCCIIEGTTTETKCDGNDTYDGTECHLIQELMGETTYISIATLVLLFVQ